MSNTNKPTPGENAWYYILCVFSFGAPYFLKIIIKRAIQEATK